jgi:hypothetical protein
VGHQTQSGSPDAVDHRVQLQVVQIAVSSLTTTSGEIHPVQPTRHEWRCEVNVAAETLEAIRTASQETQYETVVRVVVDCAIQCLPIQSRTTPLAQDANVQCDIGRLHWQR